jgi:broad specificity phosphatase PhoE
MDNKKHTPYTTSITEFAPKRVSNPLHKVTIGKHYETRYSNVMDLSEIILVRHGQANTGAKNEASYDKLSPTGHQQAIWLGDYLRENLKTCDRLICGSLRRHRETVEGINFQENFQIDPRVNEMRYFDLAEEFKIQTRTPIPNSHEEFISHAPKLFNSWYRGELDAVHESYLHFAQRFKNLITELIALGGRSVIITSGGVISMFIAELFKLGPNGFARLLFPIYNSSIHKFHSWGDEIFMIGYNATPHLDPEERHYAQTIV